VWREGGLPETRFRARSRLIRRHFLHFSNALEPWRMGWKKVQKGGTFAL
jgi:hypothetical protein